MRVCVVDGRGGGLGRRLVERLNPLVGGAGLLGMATNATAARSMREAGASHVVVDESAVRGVLSEVDVIIGPLGIVLPGALSGEVSVGLATAVLRSPARKMLLPVNQHAVEVVGVEGRTLETLIQQVVRRIEAMCGAAEPT